MTGLQNTDQVTSPGGEVPPSQPQRLWTGGLFDDVPSQPKPQPEFTLSIYHVSKPCSYILRGDAYAVGREQTNAIRVVNRFVSRRHAYLVRVPSQTARSGFTYCLIDGTRKGKSSTNGIFVNGVRVATHYLKSGDVIYFGPEVKALFFEVAPLPSVPNPFNVSANVSASSA